MRAATDEEVALVARLPSPSFRQDLRRVRSIADAQLARDDDSAVERARAVYDVFSMYDELLAALQLELSSELACAATTALRLAGALW